MKGKQLGKTKGGYNTKLSVAVNVVGLPLSILLVCGNKHDSISAVDTMRGLIEGSLVLADKAYDSDAIRLYIEQCDGIAVIPPKKNRKKHTPYDQSIGRRRHQVENFFARIKRFRRISTRYDKLAKTYIGFVKLCSITNWIKIYFVDAA